MGGCPLGADPQRAPSSTLPAAITISRICTCFDGSLFPTSIGANPQLSIYGIVAQARRRARRGARARTAADRVDAARIRAARQSARAISVFALDDAA